MRNRDKIYKRIMTLMLVLILCSSNISWEVFAANRAAEPRATNLNIPDEYLRSSIWKAIDNVEGKEDQIPTSRLADIQKIKGVFKPHEWTGDITGLQYLTGISGVNLDGNGSNNLFFPEMGNLETVTCKKGQVDALFVGQLKNLKELDCSGNQIMSLDVTQNTKLTTLNCSDNKLYQLHIGSKPELASLNVSDNSLMGLDLEGAPLLKTPGSLTIGKQNKGKDYYPSDLVNLWGENREGTDYVGLDMSKILGTQCIGRIQNPTFPSKDGTTCFYPESAKFESTDPNWDYNQDFKITYNYQVFGPSDDSVVMPVEIWFQYTAGFDILFSYLGADGVTWITTSAIKHSGFPSGKSFADKAPVPPKITGYDFVGWDRSVDYVTYGGKYTAVYEIPKTPHTVTFKDYDGSVIGEPQTVLHGGNAVAPSVPVHDGLTFNKWDKPLENITSDDVVITASYKISKFDDAVFRDFVWKEVLGGREDPYDKTLSGEHNIYTSDLPEIEKYNTTYALPIEGAANLNGIEYFKGLKELAIYGDVTPVTIKSIDLSKNTNLTAIQMFGFDLEELKLGTNPNLQIVRVYDTKLKSLDVSGCTIGQKIENDLGDLTLRNNNLEELILGEQPEILTLFVEDNPNLGDIDVTKCPKLLTLEAGNTGLDAIDVTQNPALKTLGVSYNRLTTLNVSQNTKLQNLRLSGGTPQFTMEWGNKVQRLDVSKNPMLRTLQCESNGISSLSLEKNPELVNLHCPGNEITDLDLSTAAKLEVLMCNNNKLNALDLKANEKLKRLNCSSNSSISTLDMSKNLDLAFLACRGTSLQTLDLSGQSKLQYLDCSDNSLYQLDIHKDAFDTSVTPPLSVQRTICINPQKPRTINPLLNTEKGKFEYDVNSLFGIVTFNLNHVPASTDNVSFGTDLINGSYDALSKRITFDSYAETPFTYQYSTGNQQMVNAASAEYLKVSMTPNFGTFYKVTYFDGTQNLREVEVPENGKLTKPVGIPTNKTGFDFIGWYKDQELTIPWKFETDTVTANTDLYAKWNQKEYTVTFHTQGGLPADVPGATLHYNDFVSEPSGVVILGKTLTGWYMESNYKNKWNFSENKLTGDMDLYARWEDKKYVVNYETNSPETPTIAAKQDVLYGDASLLPQDPTRTGYDFAGWKCKETEVKKDTKYKDIVDNDTVADITLTAQWTAHQFHISYDSNGGSEIQNKTNVTWEAAGLLPENAPTRPGHGFNGWSMGDTAVTSETKYCDLATDDADGTGIGLKANWVELSDYSVQYNLSGGNMPDGTPLVVTGMKYADEVSLPTPNKPGFTFDGWEYNTTIVGAGSKYSDLEKNDKNKLIVLVASWTERQDYSVIYSTEEGSMPEGTPDKVENMKYADVVGTPVPIRPGYTFTGWKHAGNLVSEGQTYSVLQPDDSISQIELTATWQMRTDYSVSYDLDGGQMQNGEPILIASMKFADTVQTPQPVKKGYTFAGWKSGQTAVADGAVYGDVAADDSVTTLALTAQWEAKHYSVRYDSGVEGITVEEKKNVTWEQTGLLPPAPKRPGYSISNWMLGEKAVSAEDKYSDLASVDTDGTSILLAANWIERKDYSVVYDVDGGTMPAGLDLSVTGLKYASKVPLPNPTKAGHAFQNWSYKETEVKADSKYSDLEEDDQVKKITLKANWKVDTHKVSFLFVGDIPEGVQTPEEITADYGTKVLAPTIKEPESWTFDGWYTDKDCTKRYDFNTLISGNLQLYGKWLYSDKEKNPAAGSGSSSGSGTASAVPTGDTNNLALLMVLSLLSCVTVVTLGRKRKKNSTIGFNKKM